MRSATILTGKQRRFTENADKIFLLWIEICIYLPKKSICYMLSIGKSDTILLEQIVEAVFMEWTVEKIKGLLDTFYKCSGIEAIYLDDSMNAVSCRFSPYMYEDFIRFSHGRIEEYLRTALRNEGADGYTFYTYVLENNLVCNIVILRCGEFCRGAAVTQPVLLNRLSESELSALINKGTGIKPDEQSSYKHALQRAPVVSYDRIMPLGEVLSRLAQALPDGEEVHQVMGGGKVDASLQQLIQPGSLPGSSQRSAMTESYDAYGVYLKLKECIGKGDADGILSVMEKINPGSVPMDQLASDSFVRSLKNSSIKVCAMCSYVSVEAGAPYAKMIRLSDEFINKIEAHENVNEIYELMKAAILAFTRAVAVTRITAYSKPVRLSIEYMENHYRDKISLELLAKQASLSPAYLSKLIKTETGLSLPDHINKIRIEESKRILLTSNAGIGELAALVGYTYSNHFAKMFKKFTGMTPSEYKKTISAEEDACSNWEDMCRLIFSELSRMTSILPGIFDVGRLVDPLANTFWMQQKNGKNLHGTCYDFWMRKQSCDQCISRMAYEKNTAFMKLEKKGDSTFFVAAAPIMIAGRRYILELLKNTSGQFFDCTEPGAISREGAATLTHSDGEACRS